MTKMKIIDKNGNLIPKNEWLDYIKQVETLEFFEKNLDYKSLLKEQILAALSQQQSKQPLSILFSGGIDSTLIAYCLSQFSPKPVCHTIGIENAPDVIWAKRVSKELDLDLETHILTKDQIFSLVKTVVSLLPADNVTAGVGAVSLAGCLESKKAGQEIVFTGLGSEEIFAGYQRHEMSTDIHQECFEGLKTMYQRDFVRDITLAKHAGVSVCAPLLSSNVIECAMRIPPSKKINEEYKKVILREVAEDLGIPKEFAWRKKKAAQYGSHIDKVIKKLAKEHNFRYRRDFLTYLKESS